MTITISEQVYFDLFTDTVECSHHPDPDDVFDIVHKYPKALGQGYWREIQLREGLVLEIGNFQLSDRLITASSEQTKDWLDYHFHFSGEHHDQYRAIGGGGYAFRGSGLNPKKTTDSSDKNLYLEVIISIAPELIYSIAGNQEGLLIPALQPWIKQPDQQYYYRCGTATATMQSIARQIIQCPYRGIAKRLYLESKALELMAILVTQEIEFQDSDCKTHALKPDTVERIYHAREILLRKLDNPPSLFELSKQVGLNSRALKEGFRQVFGKPAFSYLHHYRLEQARQLLETEEMKIAEIAANVGFASRSHFAEAFRKKFGFNPKEYQMQRKKFF
ncbi:transcriptional regulatory protein AraC family [Rivularia sp. IAM M-261]|mgnify:CR=1 FL=1|nr:transcriptional regulatory protein AraC family [Rivularia sp. IAM M-261]